MSTVHQQHQCSYAAVLNLSDKVSVCREFRTSTALPFLIPPSQTTGDPVVFQGFYKLFLKITSFLQKRAHLFLWGTTTEAWTSTQWCQPPEGDDNCSHRTHSCQSSAPELQVSTDSPEPEQWGCFVFKAAREIPGLQNSVILPVLPGFMFDLD